MHLSSDVQIPEGLLAANALLGENSRQGFGASTHTVYQGFGVAISSTALEIPGTLYDGRVRCRYTGKERDCESGNDYLSARYFGSNVGRFLSPDIVGGDLSNPQSLNRYAYALNNPLMLTDPSGFNPQQGPDSVVTGICSDYPNCTPITLPAQTQLPDFSSTAPDVHLDSGMGNNAGLGSTAKGSASSGGDSFGGIQAAADFAGMIPGLNTPANLLSAGISAYNGHYGQAALSLAFATPFVGELGSDAFESFRAFKAIRGVAEEGMQWHHIVEQTPGNLARFGPGAIHNVENLVQVPRDLHIGKGSISAYYSSKDFFTEGMTVRGWLSSQSLESQRDFGLQVLQRYGIIP